MRALVTGATGFIGTYLTRALLQRGDSVRILARTAERAGLLKTAGAEVRLGNLGEPTSIRGVADGIDTIFHLACSPAGAPMQTFERMDVEGTEQLLSEAKRAGVRRFIYVGTLAGYPLAQQPRGAIMNERSSFDQSGRLGNYARAKGRAEAAVLAANNQGGLETVIVRLGLVCGVGASVFPSHVCQPLGRDRVILFGDGEVPLPLVYIDNAVEALLLAGGVPAVGGETFNVVDDDVMTQNDYLRLLQQSASGRPSVLRVPLMAYYALGLASEVAARLRSKEPTTTPYRIKTKVAHARWDCSKAHRVLKWQPSVRLREGLGKVFSNFASARIQGS